MEISYMITEIIKNIDTNYYKYIKNESLDIIQIKHVCNLYKTNSATASNINLSEINISSPDFKKKKNVKTNKSQTEILKSPEFIKRYNFFIRIIYTCFKIEIDIFDISKDVLTLKNNHHFIKSLEQKKKHIIKEHVEILKSHYKNISKKIDQNYETYHSNYLIQIKIIDKVIGSITKLIDAKILEKTDNLLSLLLPYFYRYMEFIEEYNN